MRFSFSTPARFLVAVAALPLIAALAPRKADAHMAPASVAAASAPTPLQASNADTPAAAQTLPIWAFTPSGRRHGPPHGAPHPAQNDVVLHVPNSPMGFTRRQIRNMFSPPDWFPDSHPAMPAAVAEGRKPNAYACGYCHLPNGLGRPENQSIAGLPAAYIVEQVEDFKDGRRRSSVPESAANLMITVAKAATPEEVNQAAEYFSSLKLTKWIRVIETNTVPKTHPAGEMMVVDEGGGTEPIGDRVIEVSENLERTELRDSSSGFIAYVPVGSIAKGEALVRTGGNGETIPCTICHGPDLRGLGTIPRIAGRSPSQLARQIFNFQTGARNGVNAPLMKAPVAKLTNTDIVDITAYLASLKP